MNLPLYSPTVPGAGEKPGRARKPLRVHSHTSPKMLAAGARMTAPARIELVAEAGVGRAGEGVFPFLLGRQPCPPSARRRRPRKRMICATGAAGSSAAPAGKRERLAVAAPVQRRRDALALYQSQPSLQPQGGRVIAAVGDELGPFAVGDRRGWRWRGGGARRGGAAARSRRRNRRRRRRSRPCLAAAQQVTGGSARRRQRARRRHSAARAGSRRRSRGCRSGTAPGAAAHA